MSQQVREFEQLRERSPRRRIEAESSRSEASDLMSWFSVRHDEDSEISLQLLAKRGDEINLRELCQAEKDLFEKSDEVEWKAILGTGAVKVITGQEAEKVRRAYPSRILSSRMVRRKKPLDKVGSWKAKSRWCLHGHVDPDSGSLVTYAPTPQAESIMMFLQVALNLGFTCSFSDVRNAFCQSDKLQRKNGPIYAEPCEGLNLPKGALISIVVPVYLVVPGFLSKMYLVKS